MNLMAVFRKYNKKIMAVVVIALMIVFTIEPLMNYLSGRQSRGDNVVAYYDDNKKITSKELAQAQQQLEVLRSLGMSVFLRPQDPRLVPMQDLQNVLLGELLFEERATAAETIGRVKQIIGRSDYEISDKQINDIYAKQYPANMYWLLLVREAHMAGVQVPVESAKEQLQAVIPRLMRGVTYEQVISAIVKRSGVSEEETIETFADLMSVIEYSKMMSSIQNRTTPQNLYEASWQEEAADAEYVVFDSNTFAGQARQPSEEKIVEQFEKYKGVFAGDVSEDNPYGFGYKLPERVQLEYIAVRLSDIAATVPRPTQQETEEYYQQRASMPPFTTMVPSDPNDPNSPMKAQTRSYVEVAALISKGLYQQRVDSKAEQILLDAKSVTEANMSGLDDEKTKITGEQIKKLAIDYEKTAAELSEKYKLKVYAGKTGLLSASDIQSDAQLGILYLGGGGVTNVGLVRVLFAVDQLKTSELGPLDVKPPRLYENIGPLKDAMESIRGYSGKSMMLVRIVAAEKAAEPKSVDEKLDRRAVRFEQTPASRDDMKSIRESVVHDLRRLAAMDKTSEKANQFVQMAAKDGWDAAVDKFNELYGSDGRKTDTNAILDDERTFAIKTQTGVRRIPEVGLATLEIRHRGDPMAREVLAGARAEGMLVDKLRAVLPDDANTLASPGAVVEFKPAMSYFCLKSLTVHQFYRDWFDKVKARTIFSGGFADSQALVAVHYNPENILKRMNFILVKEQPAATKPGDTNEPNASSEPARGN
ncbi:MAG: hypothetical protein ABSG82_06095 [Sedimentisphaerales bacterium]|jgi:hypothetical protein